MRGRNRSWQIPAFLALCIVLGGASAAGYLANAILQLIGIGFLFVAALARPEQAAERREYTLYALFAAGFLLICLQFIPLSLGIWRFLPGREAILAPLEAAGIPFDGGYVSLIPHESLKSALWLLPALAIAYAMMRLRPLYSGEGLAVALVAAMCCAVLLGAMQLAGGNASPLYFYNITNRGYAVGFFANANHMASLLLVTIPFQAALLHEALQRDDRSRMAAIVGVCASMAVTVTGIFVVGSMAGYGLAVPVILASLLIVTGNRRARLGGALLLVAAVLGGMALVIATDEGRALLDRASTMNSGSRQAIFATSWKAIGDFWPAGSGIGTFAELYPSYEDPLAASRVYINHAHNDYIEILLETGVLGAALVAAFLMWWGVCAGRIWRSEVASPYAMAAAVASAALLVHSLVDYPLRTAALSAVFTACLALMAAPNPRPKNRERGVILGAVTPKLPPAGIRAEPRCCA